MTVAELLLGPKTPGLADILLVLLTIILLNVLSRLISRVINRYCLPKSFALKYTPPPTAYYQRPPRAEDLVPGPAAGAAGH